MREADEGSEAARPESGPEAATVNETWAAERVGLSPAVWGWHAFLLRKATQRVSGIAEEVLGPTGLTLRHFGILSTVEAEPGQTQRLVGARLRIDRTTMVALTDDLERLGLLERRRGTDRRTVALHLTPAGTKRLVELKKIVARVHEDFLAVLTPAEQAMLRDLLFKLVANET